MQLFFQPDDPILSFCISAYLSDIWMKYVIFSSEVRPSCKSSQLINWTQHDYTIGFLNTNANQDSREPVFDGQLNYIISTTARTCRFCFITSEKSVPSCLNTLNTWITSPSVSHFSTLTSLCSPPRLQTVNKEQWWFLHNRYIVTFQNLHPICSVWWRSV